MPGRHDGGVTPHDDTWVVRDNVDRVDWAQARADLASDNFDNGRSPAALRLFFEQSSHVALVWWDARLVGMARMLSDGVLQRLPPWCVDALVGAQARHR